MKPALLLAFLLLSACFPARAQSFAPVGAQWYHDMFWGVFKSEVTADTVVAGVRCRKIVQQPILTPVYREHGFPIIHPPNLFIHDNDDTVFVYNHLFGRFTPLYVFNVADGDTVSLPIIPDDDGCSYLSRPLSYDSTFRFVVDSVRMTLFDGTRLKTVYSHIILKDTCSFGWTRSGHLQNIYSEKIGSRSTGLTPNCFTCAHTLIDGCGNLDSLRCYSDATLSVKLVSEACDKDIPVTTVPVISRATDYWRISPNPASTLLSLGNNTLTEPIGIRVYNTSGLAVLHYNIARGFLPHFDIGTLPAGLYYVLVERLQGPVIFKGSFIRQ